MLPGASKATVESSKVRDYLLSPSHPVGRFKAAVFLALGYSQEDWVVLRNDLLVLAQTGEVGAVVRGAYGTKYEVGGSLTGPNGSVRNFKTIWLVEFVESAPRFVTAYPG